MNSKYDSIAGFEFQSILKYTTAAINSLSELNPTIYAKKIIEISWLKNINYLCAVLITVN